MPYETARPEPGAPAHAFGRVERIVNLGDVFGRDADAGVGDLNDEQNRLRRCWSKA